MSTKATFIGVPEVDRPKVDRPIAETLNYDFQDPDDLIVQVEEHSVISIFSNEGEARSREIEAEVVSRVLLDLDGIPPPGRGAILTESTRKALRECPVVPIDVDDTELVRHTK